MLTKTRLPLVCAFIFIVMLPGRTLSAAPVAVGDYITFVNGPGTTGGGEFTVQGEGIDSFITFCLQRTEYIDFSHEFHVDDISEYAYLDPVSKGGDVSTGRDYLSAQTAFLYTQFSLGSLSQYDYSKTGEGRWQSANYLQNAIWMFEQELAMNLSNRYVILANQAVTSGAWTGLGDVRVMNLSLNGRGSQDQLVLEPERDITAVPEPASLFLFGSALSAAAMARKRRGLRVLPGKTI